MMRTTKRRGGEDDSDEYDDADNLEFVLTSLLMKLITPFTPFI
jgi:hypothetical protein